MMTMFSTRLIRALFGNERGSMVIETAIVAPVLLTLALGTFEAGTIISRQHELQTAASEGEIIALAAAQGAVTETTTIEAIIEKSMNLGEDQVTVTRFFRCNANETTVALRTDCGTDDVVSSYFNLTIKDRYDPSWTGFGIGKAIDYNVERTVQLS
ncbi:pilus assembly protein [Altererythrobacter confluentis]|uniref:Pilus assembly protein n=1 Tax=Allopontixanthobacter confluentis TaxID=1849021 RepID=A0A6L7GF92_9SPHN|nr:TadE/TadG family type IV pilus assembly protein [Allopontixanthobacter confluentis]MXP14136.1 pilus assembly protein [Allopontixanthobacter confluentis]